jgi:flagellar basal-body rod protein FlgB
MTMLEKLEQALAFQRHALEVQARRQQLIASNIANADTPGYKARDLDFRAALSKAQSSRSVPRLEKTDPDHLSVESDGPLAEYEGYRTEVQSAVDGNTVDMDQERTAFAETAFHYEASLNFINRLLKGMRTAITGQ